MIYLLLLELGCGLVGVQMGCASWAGPKHVTVGPAWARHGPTLYTGQAGMGRLGARHGTHSAGPGQARGTADDGGGGCARRGDGGW